VPPTWLAARRSGGEIGTDYVPFGAREAARSLQKIAAMFPSSFADSDGTSEMAANTTWNDAMPRCSTAPRFHKTSNMRSLMLEWQTGCQLSTAALSRLMFARRLKLAVAPSAPFVAFARADGTPTDQEGSPVP